MPIKWNLRELLRQLEIRKASEISRIIYDRTEYPISTQAVCDLLNDKPKMLRLDTAQAFCDALVFDSVISVKSCLVPRESYRQSLVTSDL
jgi:hypothetical protein